MKKQSKQDLSNRKAVALIATLVALLIIIGAYYLYDDEYKTTLAEKQAQLKSVAQMKLKQIEIWYNERNGDAKVFGNSPFFTMGVKKFLDNKNNKELANDILHRMKTFVEVYDYEDMILVDINGNKVLDVGDSNDTIDEQTIEFVSFAIAEKRVVFSDFYYCELHDAIHYDIITPLYGRQGEPFGAFILRVNPENILFPIIETWPIPTETAETILIRNEGDSLRYMTKLRKSTNERYHKTKSILLSDLPSVKAASGEKGHIEGIDYSGSSVLAFVADVPNTRWILITKIDKSEAFSEFKERMLFSGLFILILLGTVIFGVSYQNRSQQRNFYREMYEKEVLYQAALKEKEQLLLETQAIAKVGGWEFDAVTLEGAWTEETARIHDLEPGDPTNVEIWLNFFVNGSRQIIERAVDEAIKYGKPYDLELEMISAKGKQKWVRTIAHPVVIDGKVVRVRGTIQDITDFKRVQLELIESREELAITLNSIGDGVITTDRNGIITGINPVAGKLVGYPKDEVIGMPFDEVFRIIDASTREKIDSPVGRVLMTGEVIELSNHTLLLSRDGREINISDSAAPIMDIDKDIRGVVLVFSDVTQAYETRQRLRESEEKFRLLFENMLEGFALYEIILDNDGNPIDYVFIEVNPEFEKMTGLVAKEILGKRVSEVIPGVEQFWIDTYGKVAITGQTCKFENYARAIGKYFDVWAYSPKKGYFATIISDITKRKNAEYALEQSERNYREIFNSTKEAIFIYDSVTLKLIDANQTMLEMYGYDDFDELMNSTIGDRSAINDESTQNKIFEYIRKADSEGAQTFEWLARKKSGEVFWTEVSLQKTNIGGEGRILAVVRDIDERKKAAEELLKAQEQYRLMANNTSDTITMFDMELNILYVSPAVKKQFGFEPEEVMDMGLQQLLTPESMQHFYEIYQDEIAAEVSGDRDPNRVLIIELDEYTKWGEILRIEVSVSFMRDSEQRAIGVITVSRDITEKRKVELLLKRSEELARNTLNCLSAHIAIVNQEGIVEAVNQAWLDFAVENNAILEKVTVGSNYLSACENATGNEHRDALIIGSKIRELLNDEITNFELEYPCHSSTEKRWFIVRLTKFPGEKKVVVAHENVTKQKLAELLLKEEQERLQLAIFAGHLGIFDLNITTGYTKINSQYAIMLGYDPDTFEEKGDGWLEMVHPDDVDDLRRQFKEHISGKERIYDTEFRIKTYSGDWKWIRSIGAIVEWDKKGNPTRMIGIRQDITGTKKLHNELIAAKEKAEESDRLKTAFLQNMSHEIRTPLNGIIGFSELLKDDTLTKEEQEEFTKIIQLSGKRLIEIVNNVLDISKIDTGQMNVVNKPFALNSIIYDLYDFFYSQADMKSLKLTHSVELSDEGSFIISDSTKLQQILTNLLNNAIKFTDVGDVTFGYKLQNNELQFHVRDSGIGIGEEHFEQIFDRFYQTDLSISRHFEGAGLGLSICKGLVELLGGRIWLESEVGKGTSFYFTLPYVPEKFVHSTPESSLSKPSKKKIVALVAEDDETSFILLRTILTDNNFEVIHACNGMEAIEFCRNRDDIDVVLMDIRMPVIDGKEATQKIKSFRPNLPIIGQAAYAFSNERDEIIKAGCDYYISKPINIQELMSILTHVLNS